MRPPNRLALAMTPMELGMALPGERASCAIVIDALRATTTVTALFDSGARSVMAVKTIEAAREIARSNSALLAGEVHGLPPDGFDLGNSPVDARRADTAGKDVVLFTTNGTQALCAASAEVVIAAALTNISVVAGFAARRARVNVICAGNGGGRRFAMEDFAVAGALVGELCRGGAYELDDAARLALHCFGNVERDVVTTLLAGSDHAELTRTLGLGADVEYACKWGISRAVPVVVESGEGWVRLENAAET